MNLRESSIGDSSPEPSQGTKGKLLGQFVDSSGAGKQDALQHAATSKGSGWITIETMDQLRNAINLTKLSQVTRINLEWEEVGEGDFKLLAEALASGQMSALGNLELWNAGLTEDTCVLICTALTSRKLPSLSRIDIYGGNIGTKAAEALGRALQSGNLENLRSLSLRNTGIDDNGMAELASAFQHSFSPHLTKLVLRANSFTEVGMQSLAEALKSGNLDSLQHLVVSSNDIGTKGVEALGRALQSGNLKNVRHLDLSKTGIDDNCMAELGPAMQHSLSPNLEWLDLAGNSFTEVGMQSLAETLKCGRLDSLKRLHVTDCHKAISEGSAKALVSALTLNNLLTMNVYFEWDMFPALSRRSDELQSRNERQKEIHKILLPSPQVPAAFGKVYLCGNPMVGKTTLSHTLQRSFRESLLTSERRPRAIERTRGIDVSRFSSRGTIWIPQWISSKQTGNPITLLVWDMAGQQDYHLVHHSFLPDLSFSEGKATTFVIVCTSKDLAKSARELRYWLQYIASSCDKSSQNLRRIFVVLNNIRGDKKVKGYAQDWEKILQGERDNFKGLLEVGIDLFMVDVRRRQNVLGLKKCLLDYSRNVLKDEQVPELCRTIQTYLSAWSLTRKQFPVVCWEEFVQDVRNLIAPWGKEVIEAGAKYLNEVGVLIHIDKKFPPEWGIPYRRLIVLDPNWICREVIGNIFLSADMVNQIERRHLFRDKVDRITGSISILDFKKFFKSLLSEWNESQFDDLIVILLWLGLCYKGIHQNVFIPALIDKIGEPGDPWQAQRMQEHQEEQWVMGFSIERKESELTLAPLSLWHRFQVELAQTLKFNGAMPDNDFTAGKNFMIFTVDYMNVQIRVNATEDLPTFEEIKIFIKPILIDKWNGDTRKQHQVDLANELVHILLGLWETVCPTVEYLCRVVWPWPASQPKPRDQERRNVEVIEVKKWVQEHGLGRTMHWTVGSHSAITEDQLLSTNDKKDIIKAVETDILILKGAMREAVSLRIYPSQLTGEPEDTFPGCEGFTFSTNLLNDRLSYEESLVTSDWIEEASQPTSETSKLLIAMKKLEDKLIDRVDKVGDKVDAVTKQLNDVKNMLRKGFAKVLNEQKKVLRKLQDTETFFLEDKDRTCPNLIYLGQKDSGIWATLKAALSPSVSVCLRFACEAMYNNYRPHEVKEQQGLDVSSLKAPIKKIAPWLKVSLTVLLISAKVGANFVAPGLGWILPDFQQWQQASSLLEGIEWATGFPKAELDQVIIEEMRLDPNGPLWNPQEVYGKSRGAITDLIGKLSPEAYEQKFGLRKVCLNYSDGSLHGVAWICTDCLKNFRDFDLVSEL